MPKLQGTQPIDYTTVLIPTALYQRFLASCVAVDRSPPPGDGPNDRMPLERTAALLRKQRALVEMVASMQIIEEGT